MILVIHNKIKSNITKNQYFYNKLLYNTIDTQAWFKKFFISHICLTINCFYKY